MAARYGATVMPARVRAPRDKPSVENEVWQVTTETFAAPRNRAFVNMGEPKAAVAERLREHGPRPLSEREETRRQVLEEQERPLARLRTDVFPDRWDDLYPWVIDELLRIRKVTSSL